MTIGDNHWHDWHDCETLSFEISIEIPIPNQNSRIEWVMKTMHQSSMYIYLWRGRIADKRCRKGKRNRSGSRLMLHHYLIKCYYYIIHIDVLIYINTCWCYIITSSIQLNMKGNDVPPAKTNNIQWNISWWNSGSWLITPQKHSTTMIYILFLLRLFEFVHSQLLVFIYKPNQSSHHLHILIGKKFHVHKRKVG